jgi:hypothetical protein
MRSIRRKGSLATVVIIRVGVGVFVDAGSTM